MVSASFIRLQTIIARLTAACLCCGTALSPSPARAAILTWVNASGGPVSTPGNWNPAQLPNAGDQLIFPLISAYTVTFNSAVPGSQVHTYREGSVTLNITSPHTTNATIVGDAIGDNPIVTLTTGNLTATAAVVGNQAGCVGTLNINDDDATLNALNQFVVGSSGNGTLNITNNGTASALFFTAGHATTAIAAMNVSGAGSTLDINQSATIGNSGDATLTIGALGHVLVAQDMFIAAGSTSVSQINLNGGAALLDVDGDIHVGANLSASPAGSGTLSATLAGICIADRIFLAGDAEGGSGTLHIDTGGAIDVGSLICGDTGATLDLDEGLIVVRDVLEPPNGVLTFLSGTGGTPVVKLVGATMTAAAPTAGGNAIQVSGGGELFLDSGSQAQTTQGNVVFSSTSAAPAKLTLLNASSFETSASIMHIGLSGDAASLLDSNSQLHALNLFLATNLGSSGTLEVFGGADIETTVLRVGGGTTSGGTGLLNVQDADSTITVNGSGNCTHVYPSGTVYVGQGAVFTNAASFSHLGLLIVEGGVVNTGSMSIGGDVIAHGAINGSVSLGNISPDATIHASGGPLTLGDAASTFGFFGTANSVLNVDDEIVTIADSSGADLGNTTLNAGTLNLPNTSRLNPGKTLSGFGTINGNIQNLGTITSTASGLNFGGFLVGPTPSAPQNTNGTTIRFLTGGGFTGQGSIAANVDGDANSIITATGPLTMGNSASASGVILDGELHVSAHTVTLNDSNGVGMGSLTTIGGGTLAASAGNLVIGSTDTLIGFGTVQAGLVNVGVVEAQTQVGALSVTGNYTHIGAGGPGDLRINLNASSSGLHVAGSATLAGELTLTYVGPSLPTIGAQHEIISAQSINGAFSNVVLLGFPPCLDVQMSYVPTSVMVTIIASVCPADIEPPGGDGAVNVSDLLAVIRDWGQSGGGVPGDVTTCGTGVVNIADLLAVISAWGPCS